MAPDNQINKKLQDFFDIADPAKSKVKNAVECKYCSKTYSHHTTRLTSHILNECTVVSETNKQKLKDLIESKGKGQNFSNNKVVILHTSASANLIAVNDSSHVNSLLDQEQQVAKQLGEFEVVKKKKVDYKSFFDTMTRADQNKGSELLARAIFTSGSPLSLLENPDLRTFLQFLRPSYAPPSRFEGSNSLLNNEYKRVKEMVDSKVAKASSLCLQVDTWTNVKSEAVMNFLLSTPEPVYFDSIDVGTNHENSQFIHDEIKKIIDAIDVRKLIAVISDNVSANRAAWNLLDQTYRNEHLAFYGCAGHIGQLFIKDVGNIPSVSRIIDNSSKIVNQVKKKRTLISNFTRIQKDNVDDKKKITLKLAGKTRWDSNVRCLTSVLVNKINLQRLAICENVVGYLDAEIKAMLLDEKTWWEIEQAIALKPVLDWITIWDGDSIRLSLVFEGFYEIGKKLQDFINGDAPKILNFRESTSIKQAFTDRRDMALPPIHFAANFLDPNFRAKNISQSEFDMGYKYIFAIASKFSSASRQELIQDIADYYEEKDFYAQDHVIEATKILHPVQSWKTICGNPSNEMRYKLRAFVIKNL